MLNERKAIKNLKPYTPGKEIPGAIKLASNENPLGPSPQAMDAIRHAADQLSLYPDGNCTNLKNKLSQKYCIKPENIVVGNGSDEILLLIAGAFIEPGDEVVIAQPTFSEYEFSARLLGAIPVFVPLTNGAYDLNAMAQAITPQTKVVYLCNPNNPTGTIFFQNDLDEFLARVPEDILVVMDEAYVEYVTHTHYPQSMHYINEKNIVVLRTFSKIYGLAGLRVGYGLASPEIIASLNKAREPFNVNRLAQIAATAALDDEAFLQKSKENNEAGKKYLYTEFDKLSLTYLLTEANFIFAETPMAGIEIFQALMDQGITIRPMASFGCDNAVRVTIGTEEQNQALIKGLRKLH